MAHFLMSVYDDGSPPPSDEEMQEMFETVGRFNEQLKQDGRWVFGGGLLPAESSSVVDGTKGDVTVTDGPFVEAKEYIAGFWVIDVESLQVAQQLAGEASKACLGPVEVRPFGEGE